MKIAIIDYGMGNLRSVSMKVKKLGYEYLITSNPDDLLECDRIILPGVGHFGKGMGNLEKLGFINPLNEEVMNKKKPLLGICLGMQMLTDFSEEGGVAGLGWIHAKTVKFNFGEKGRKVPHMGWNSISLNKESSILKGIEEQELFYFVHSYYVLCNSPEDEIASTEYGIKFSSAIGGNNVFGVQFHPEKSHEWGAKIIQNFCEI